jgi:precorrin-6Y C5,15-methyltransferase (decarboxylating)
VSAPPLVVVGIGADGWAGLGEAARAAVLAAEVIVGSQRQLALLPESAAERRPWPSPIDPLVDELCSSNGAPVCILRRSRWPARGWGGRPPRSSW